MYISLDSCRICLGTKNLQNIFEEQRDIPIRQKIVYCAAVQVSQGDSLPEMICNQCLFYLDIAYVFKTVCEATDKKLRDFQLTKEIGEFEETDYDIDKDDTCNENEDTAGLLNIASSNVESNCENSHSVVEIYPNNVIQESVEISHFIDEHDIEETVLHEDFEETIKSEQEIAIPLEQEEVNVEIAAESEENTELMVSNETEVDLEGDKQILTKNNLVEDDLIRGIDNPASSEMGKQKDNSPDADNSEKNILKESTRDKVGRHIAKKITGKFPQKLHQNNSKMVDDKQRLFENKLKDQIELKDVDFNDKVQEDGVQNFEDILENDVPMVVFEETVVTAMVVTDNQSFPYHAQDIVNKPNVDNQPKVNNKKKLNASLNSFSENSAKGKRNENPKIKIKISPMTLRKGSRKVNVFDDHSKSVKAKQKKKVRDLTKKSIRAVSTNKTVDGFKCDVCNKSFPFRSHLIRHLNMHTGIKRYTCEYCKQKFINNYNLSVHMLKHTGEFPLKCDVCNKGFPNPSLLKRHMTTHTGEANFQCRYCSVKFTQSSSLKLHERMHLHRPSYHCDICYKVFSYTNSLAAHKKLHFGAKRFSCDICLTTFSRKSSLIRHMEGHTKFKKIKCKFCDMSFNSKNSYYSHLKTHCKHKCEVCGESFRYKTNLVNHIKNHKDSFKCEQCYKQFQNKAQLVKHLEKHIK